MSRIAFIPCQTVASLMRQRAAVFNVGKGFVAKISEIQEKLEATDLTDSDCEELVNLLSDTKKARSKNVKRWCALGDKIDKILGV